MAVHGVTVRGALKPGFDAVLTDEALTFVANLHRQYNPTRLALLNAREARQAWWDAGNPIDFAPETASVRAGTWTVAGSPPDLQDRRVEITGPVDRKMVINALNCGARCFMADFEDASSPVWETMIEGQINLRDAVAGTITLEDKGKSYKLNDTTATLIVRPRGWHLPEAHITLSTGRSLPARSSTSGCSSSTTPARWSPRDRGRISTCPSSSIISRRGCGTTSSSTPSR